MSEHLSTIDLSDIPAAIAKVQGHTGRELCAIVADFACCTSTSKTCAPSASGCPMQVPRMPSASHSRRQRCGCC